MPWGIFWYWADILPKLRSERKPSHMTLFKQWRLTSKLPKKVQQDGWMGIDPCFQHCWHEFNPWGPHGRREELTSMVWCACPHTNTHRHTDVMCWQRSLMEVHQNDKNLHDTSWLSMTWIMPSPVVTKPYSQFMTILTKQPQSPLCTSILQRLPTLNAYTLIKTYKEMEFKGTPY